VQRCQGVVLIQDYCYSGNSGQGGYQPYPAWILT
jgi:hypothetical protein